MKEADNRDSKSSQDRAVEDFARTQEDGTVLTMDQRKALLRAEWTQELLPNIDGDERFHYCWLSTTNQSDPIYRRLQLGYELVKATELPSMALQNQVVEGEFAGCIAINEMILAKIHRELYQELMLINHYERPLGEEELLKANAVPDDKVDSKGRRLIESEGDGLEKLGVPRKAPSFL